MDFFTYLWQLDSSLLLWFQSIRQEWMTPFWKFVTSLGDAGWFWIALALFLLCFRSTRRAGLAAFIALAIGALITNVIFKPSFARIRPYEVIDSLILLVEKQKDFSFPSGHSCASFAAVVALRKHLPRRIVLGLLILATLIAISRLYVGVHYPSDVLGGILIGTFAGWIAGKIIRPLSSPS
ncbi:MAG: phosphatase PAP2 family protein [Lachnospiraceae bacterium]|nr:phosphatase PAP2 family protein [Lachnospiraceae bacterium]